MWIIKTILFLGVSSRLRLTRRHSFNRIIHSKIRFSIPLVSRYSQVFQISKIFYAAGGSAQRVLLSLWLIQQKTKERFHFIASRSLVSSLAEIMDGQSNIRSSDPESTARRTESICFFNNSRGISHSLWKISMTKNDRNVGPNFLRASWSL